MGILGATFTSESKKSINITYENDLVRTAPVDEKNLHYAAVKMWVKSGGTVGDYQTPPETTPETNYSQLLQSNHLLKVVIQSINDGSFVPGGNLSDTELRDVFKNKLI